jgi:hypothetical protein
MRQRQQQQHKVSTETNTNTSSILYKFDRCVPLGEAAETMSDPPLGLQVILLLVLLLVVV